MLLEYHFGRVYNRCFEHHFWGFATPFRTRFYFKSSKLLPLQVPFGMSQLVLGRAGILRLSLLNLGKRRLGFCLWFSLYHIRGKHHLRYVIAIICLFMSPTKVGSPSSSRVFVRHISLKLQPGYRHWPQLNGKVVLKLKIGFLSSSSSRTPLATDLCYRQAFKRF